MNRLDALLTIYHQALTGTILNMDVGICPALNVLGHDGESIIKRNCRQWKYFSGSPTFPIPGKNKAYLGDDLWEGKQLKYRLSLLRHLIKQERKHGGLYPTSLRDYDPQQQDGRD